MKREFLFPLVMTFTLLIKGICNFFFPTKEKRFTYIDTLATLVITLLSHVVLDMLFIFVR